MQKNTLVPDIAIGEEGKFKYWIEIVYKHASTEHKRRFIKDKDWIVLEFHIQQVDDMKNKRLECYNINKVCNIEYSYIKNAYKLYSRIFENKDNKKVRAKSNKPPKITKVESLEFISIKKHIDMIFDALGEASFNGGQSLNYEKVIDSISSLCNIKDIEPYIKDIDKYLRFHHSCSILYLESDNYLSEIIEKFNFKRRRSIIHIDISKKFLSDNEELKKSYEY